MVRKWLALLLSLIMTAGLLAGCAKEMEKPPEPPKERAEQGTATLIIHYHRYNGDYEPWDLWVWVQGKEGAGYPFTDRDEFGAVAVITVPERADRLGFIVRKGGSSWTAKDVTKDRFIDVTDGRAEIWVVEGQEAFATRLDQVSTAPKVKAAYLDSRRSLTAQLSHPLELTGQGTEGFQLNPPLPIESVSDGRLSDLGLIGYQFINGGGQIRFVLEPGRLGFRKAASDGKANLFISGPFNGWGGTAAGSFKPMEAWKMSYSGETGRYELVVPVGEGEGQVPRSGSEFKFTEDRGGGQEWYPSANIAISAPAGKGTYEVLITLAADADITRSYTLEHAQMEPSLVLKRGVLDDPAFVYTGDDLGHRYGTSGTRFRLWAPTVSGVEVLLYDGPTGGSPQAHPMRADAGGTWLAEIPGNLKDRYYTFRLLSGGTKAEVMDPYAVGAGINGNRALIVNLKETNPPGWETHRRPPFGPITDAVIYEVHVRDLSTHVSSGITDKGKFLGLAQGGTRGPGGVKTGLDHLVELGITHVHLLPPFDFASVDEARPDQFNWGYDPKNFNVPEGSYATDPNGTARITEFKQMVQALHQAGLRVVIDVVYNHTSVGASPFEEIAPHYYYRWDAAGRMANGSGTGNETASERPMMRKYIVDSVRYWATEYQIDGFRFDLMGLHDVETMRQVRQALDQIDPSIIVYGEPWTGGASPLEPSVRMGKGAQKGMNIAVFNDHIRNAIKGDNDGVIRGFATGAGALTMNIQRGVVGSIDFDNWIADFTRHPGESINYVSSHDNLTLWDKIANSNKVETAENRIRMDLLSQAIIFTSQGVPFMQGGEELLRTKGGNHNSYNAPDSVNQFDWSRKQKYRQVFDYYQGLIAIRRAHPAFRLTTAEAVRQHLQFLEPLPPNTVAFWLKDGAGGDSWRQIVVIYNPNQHEVEVKLPLPGAWQVAAHGTTAGNGPVAGIKPVTATAKVPPISMMLLYQQ